MLSFADLIQQGAAHAWLFIPSAILLGALHGLEPGHSKTMMAAFIVAVRGTVTQAVLLGLAATASHTLVVWAIGLGGMYLWRGVDAEAFEPYFQLASAAIIVIIALWMLWRTWRDEQRAKRGEGMGGHGHDHDHSHSHDHDHDHALHAELPLRTVHASQPHDHSHEHHDHHEPQQDTSNLTSPAQVPGVALAVDGYQDAHERAHANDIQRRFADRKVTTWQIVVFGLTGGLIPCPAAITVLLLCLQLKEFTLGFALVLCFSIGLAITLVTVGALAALSVRHASTRWSWFSTFARRAPYVSSLLIIAVGVYVGINGWMGLSK